MEKDPKCYVECNVDVGERERERERERCVETHPHDKTWRKDRYIDRQKDGKKRNRNVLIKLTQK